MVAVWGRTPCRGKVYTDPTSSCWRTTLIASATTARLMGDLIIQFIFSARNTLSLARTREILRIGQLFTGTGRRCGDP
jgi:hypothetical protein